MAWETDFCFIKDLLYKHEAFVPLADDLIKIYDFLEALYPNNKSDNKSSKETFGETKDFQNSRNNSGTPLNDNRSTAHKRPTWW